MRYSVRSPSAVHWFADLHECRAASHGRLATVSDDPWAALAAGAPGVAWAERGGRQPSARSIQSTSSGGGELGSEAQADTGGYR